MVRINIVNPRKLADQHLIAEYAEIIMLVKSTKRMPDFIPNKYCLGKGHQNFFKNKLRYLKKRHKLIRKEMIKRGFKPKIELNVNGFGKEFLGDWRPDKADYQIIRKRLTGRIKKKNGWYRYYGKKMKIKFFLKLLY